MIGRVLVIVALVALAACGRKEAGPAAPASSQATAAAVDATRYDQTLEYAGISFHVVATGDGTLTITPSGLEGDNSPVTQQIDGTVTRAEVADLNVDNSPEIYVYTQVTGSGSYGSLVAYSANDRKSLSPIYLPPVTDLADAAKGYMGHDEFDVIENSFVRRFPVYKDGDTNAEPTGGTRQFQYKLVPGEAGWVLKVDKIVAY